MSDFKLSPSDFAFSYDGCKRCFYYKVVRSQKTPLVLPNIFKIIDELTKDFFEGKDVKEIDKSLPPGKVIFGDRKVKSKPLKDEKSGNRCIISGRTDTIVEFEDGTHGVVDFKTSKISKNKARTYSRQLHAYALALENAETGFYSCRQVSKLGVFVMEPEELVNLHDGNYGLMTKAEWIEIKRDDDKFKEFLREVLALLGNKKAPGKTKGRFSWDGCQNCYWWCHRDEL